MNPTDSDSTFLAAGLLHFPDAYATVDAFRRLVAERVQAILDSSRPDIWKPKEVKATRSESNGLWVGAGGPMALESVPGKFLILDVGIVWNRPQLKKPIMAGAYVVAAEDVLMQRLSDPSDAGVRLVRFGKNDLFVTALGGDALDVEGALRRVVEAAASAVAGAIAGRPNAETG